MTTTVIHLRVDAPTKPRAGEPCNGCGVCCTAGPCPLGMLVSRRTGGACAALVWDDESPGRYRCGLITRPALHWPRALAPAAPWLARVARRCVAAGVACDCEMDVVGPSTPDRPTLDER